MNIKDLITGEILSGLSKYDAIVEAERRVAIHKSDFCYRHRGRHYPVNAAYKIEGSEITIYVEE